MDEQTKSALDWILTKYSSSNDLIRSYPMNMVIFIASLCALYHAESVAAEGQQL